MVTETKYYVLTMLPFGLATSCYLFMKLMPEVVYYWWHQGIQVILYLHVEDGTVVVGNVETKIASCSVQKDVKKGRVCV